MIVYTGTTLGARRLRNSYIWTLAIVRERFSLFLTQIVSTSLKPKQKPIPGNPLNYVPCGSRKALSTSGLLLDKMKSPGRTSLRPYLSNDTNDVLLECRAGSLGFQTNEVPAVGCFAGYYCKGTDFFYISFLPPINSRLAHLDLFHISR